MERKIENKNKVFKIIQEYPRKKRYTLAILQDIQKEYDFIPRESIKKISNYLEVPVTGVYSIATFYKALSLKPKGKYIIKVCNGTACHIRGSDQILDEIYSLLKIKPGQTTEDGLFSVEIVNCLGACALAPVMVINDKCFGSMTKDKVKEVLDSYRRQEND